jgi:hypothetical protein
MNSTEGSEAMARARNTAKSTNAATSQEHKCPECGRAFTRAAALGAHRKRAHGVAGASAQSKSRRARTSAKSRPAGSTNGATAESRMGRTPANAAAAASTSRGASARTATSRRSRSGVNRDELLQALFPNGIPARESVIRELNGWLDEAERLSRLG